MRALLVLVAALSSACAKPSQSLPPTVGESSVGRPAPAGVATTAPPDGDACGAEPPIVTFDPTSRDLSAAHTEELARLAVCLSAPPSDALGVILVGYTDVMGTVPANLELGLARAQAVMRQLIDHGVAPGRIVVASAGELQRPAARWGQQAHRVEVLLAHGGPTRPNEAPVARGIEAEGLMPRRPASPAAAPSTPAARPAARPAPAAASTARPTTRSR